MPPVARSQAPDAGQSATHDRAGRGDAARGHAARRRARATAAGRGSSSPVPAAGPGRPSWAPPRTAPQLEGPVDVRIVVDAVDFCRLVANRLDPATIATVVTGDDALARDLFTGAASLALD